MVWGSGSIYDSASGATAVNGALLGAAAYAGGLFLLLLSVFNASRSMAIAAANFFLWLVMILIVHSFFNIFIVSFIGTAVYSVLGFREKTY
jgi:hypothetical protein